VSNALSQRGAFQQAVESAKDKAGLSAVAPERAKKPGTQLMQNAPNRPTPMPADAKYQAPAKAAQEPPAPVKAPPRTVAMNFNSVAKPGMLQKQPSTPSSDGNAAPARPSAAPNTASNAAGSIGQGVDRPMHPQSTAQPPQPLSAVGPSHHLQPPSGIQPSGIQPSGIQPSGIQPSGIQPSGVYPGGAMQTPSAAAIGQPPSGIHGAPGAMGQPPAQQPVPPHVNAPYNPAAAYPQQPAYAQPAPGAGGWGWNAAPSPIAQPVQGGQYPYAYVYTPGARVHVTWSNGQRYPATVNQVSGSQCLVVFPDGQQHWVEMQYLTLG
jgi:hypothetical protein